MDESLAYNDNYPTCFGTSATLYIFTDNLDPQTLTERLGVIPTGHWRKGEISSVSKTGYRISNCWFLGSAGIVNSKDLRRHMDWLFDQILPQKDIILALQNEGCRMNVYCFWESKNGHGGPTLSPLQMKKMVNLNIKLDFHFFFDFST